MSEKIVPCVWMIKGSRWPWYPYWKADVVMSPLRVDDEGEVTGNLRIVGEVQRGRIGLPRWVKIKWHRLLRHP